MQKPRTFVIALFRNLLWLLLSTAAALAAAEGLLRWIGHATEPPWGWQWRESPYRSAENASDHRVNQLGLRGRPFAYGPEDFVVLIAGDSFAEAGAQPFDAMPEQLLESLLVAQMPTRRVRVFSVAAAGWGQDQQLIALRDYFGKHRADLVIAWLTPVNDFWENTFVERGLTAQPGRFKPTFRLSASGDLDGPMVRHQAWRLQELILAGLAKWRPESIVTPEQRTFERWLRALPPSDPQPVTADVCPTLAVAQDGMVAARRAGHEQITVLTTEAVGQARSHFAPFGVPPSARERYQIDLTRRLLQEMAALTRGHGGRFAAFYPYGSDMDRGAAAVRCVKELNGGRYFARNMDDLLAPLKVPDPGFSFITPRLVTAEATAVSSADWHLNRRGNELALGMLADVLSSDGWLTAGPVR